MADDLLNCGCGGRRTVVAVVIDANTARSLLAGLGIPHRSPVFTARGAAGATAERMGSGQRL